VRHFEDAWARLRARPEGLPRATVNIIAGPSRTGDVELTMQLGAHGPRSVQVLLVEAGPAKRVAKLPRDPPPK
jgi:L-lactate dehydrogenase complex protein LldG